MNGSGCDLIEATLTIQIISESTLQCVLRKVFLEKLRNQAKREKNQLSKSWNIPVPVFVYFLDTSTKNAILQRGLNIRLSPHEVLSFSWYQFILWYSKSYFVPQFVTPHLHKVSCARYQVQFYLWRIEPVLKLCKIPKDYGQEFTWKWLFVITSKQDFIFCKE